MKIDISVTKILNENEFSDIESHDYVENVGQAVNIPIKNVWEKRHTYVSPGRKSDCIALQYHISIQEAIINKSDLNNVVLTFFCEEFGEKNVLSLKQNINEELHQINYLATAYPLNHRVLDESLWLTESGDIKEEFRLKLFKKITEAFSVEIENNSIETKEDLKEKIKNTKSHAEINLIEDMDISPEDIEEDEEVIYDAAGLSRQVRTDLSYEKLENIFNNALKTFTVGSERMQFKKAQMGDLRPEIFANQVSEYLNRYYPGLSENDKKVIINKIIVAVYGNYVLEDLLNDDRISDIKVLAPDKIRVKVNGKRMTSNLHFIDADDYRRFIEGLAIRNNLDLREPIHVFTDKYTNPNVIMRFNITTPGINSVPYPYLHIRKIKKDKYSIDDLIKFQMMDRKTADYLINKAKHGKGLVFTGKGASGKTTLMNVLLDEIPKGNSALIIQESEELFTKVHPDFMFQHVTPDYTLKELAKNGLLTDLDYFVIGEIKGEEAMYFLNAAATGHRCWCSVHSASSKDAIGKLADYVMYESKYDKAQAMYMLKELDTIVFMDHFKVTEISEIVGWDNEKQDLIYRTVYKK